jgi:hypothetical protein
VIPVLIALGLVLGRWWRTALAVGVIAWVATGLATDVFGWASVPAAAGLALANTAVGVLVHQGVLRALRWGASDRTPETA